VIPRRLILLCLVLLAALAAGCGLGPGDEQEGEGARVVVTRDFGHQQLGTASERTLREGQTVMRMLQSDFDVETRFGGGFVQSIDGLAGQGAGGQRDWFYFVNGVEAEVGAADYELSPGDRVQWDYRGWKAADRVPAIVGAYPEPLRSGWEDKRRPVRVECEDADSTACKRVLDRLHAADVAANGASLGAPYTETIVRVIVGRWQALRQSVSQLEDGPERSGVFARFAADGRSLDLLDAAGEPLRTVEPGDGVGLVAALFPREEQLAWVVTGLDDEAVDAAASALDGRSLRNAFAVAAGVDGVQKLPLTGEGAQVQ
jgi:Domain of unknown function (DUF4430)